MSQRFGRYELLGKLGRGGMAELFLARYCGPGGFEKRLVIKRVLPSLSGDRRFLKMFFEEARLQVSLSHGSLVPVFDFGRVGNAYFIAMEHVPGCDLATLLERARTDDAPLGPRLVAHIGIKLCGALAYVHRRGLVHRDVGPRNVLLSLDGEVKLADFGVALSADDEHVPGVRGTLAYMAPEQVRGERPDGRADLFALGLVLAEALLLKRPRTLSEASDPLAAARDPEPILLEGPLGRVIARAAAPVPADRFASADEMLQALEDEARSLASGDAATARDLGMRVTAAAASVAEILAVQDDANDTKSDSPRSVPEGAGSYYRDSETKGSFVEEVLTSPRDSASPVRTLRRRLPLLAAAIAAAAIVVAVVAIRLERGAFHPLPTLASNPPPRREPDAPPPAALPPPLPVASLTPAHPEAPNSPSERRAAPLASATVDVYCTPWCVMLVDDAPRGEDGRHHELAVRSGRHRISARRLDDHETRTIDLRPGESRRMDFRFE